MTSTDKLVVGAIDFGTTYSGYAYKFRGDINDDATEVLTNYWIATDANLFSCKAPTAVLLDDEKKFVAFGYEAESKYAALAQENKHGEYYYFHRFKMMLYEGKQRLTREITIKDVSGKELPAILVFEHAIRFLKDHLLEVMKNRQTDNIIDLVKEMYWVLTVPAIWDDMAKQFMRQAAEEAGIDGDHLTIALEPEAASLYCQHLPLEKLSGAEPEIIAFKPGSRYLVLDAGGGTVDITVHEVQDDKTLKELEKASGGSWGGTQVDQAFVDFLGELFGEEVLEDYEQHHRADYLGLMRYFEIKKRKFGKRKPTTVLINLPITLLDFTDKKINAGFENKFSITHNKLRINRNCFESFFENTATKIITHVRELLTSDAVIGTDIILMVGGFSESPFLQNLIKDSFPQHRLIVPRETGLSILKGAVLFGYMPYAIRSRVMKHTYGIKIYTDFDTSKHDPGKIKLVGGKEKCSDIFDRHVKCGQSVKIDESQDEKIYDPLYPDQKQISFKIYISDTESPMYTDGCTFLGKLTIDIPDQNETKNQEVSVQMQFGFTELKVKAKVLHTGDVVAAKFHFLDG